MPVRRGTNGLEPAWGQIMVTVVLALAGLVALIDKCEGTLTWGGGLP